MPPQSFSMDPVELYLKFPRIADFVIFWVLFSLLVRVALHGAKQLGEKKTGGWLSSTKKEHDYDNPLSAVVGLMMTLGIMAYGKISLEGLVTSGLLPGFLGLFFGFIAYNGLKERFEEENKYMAIVAAVLIGVLVFSIITFKPAGGNISGLIFFLVLAFIGWTVFSKIKPKDPSKTAKKTEEDIDKAGKTADKAAADAEKGKAAADKINKEKSGLQQQLDKALNSIQTLNKIISGAFGKSKLIAPATVLAFTLFNQGQNITFIKNELAKTYPKSVIEKVVEALPKTRGAPAPTPKPTTEETPVTDEDAATITDAVKKMIEECEALDKTSQSFISHFTELINSLNAVPSDCSSLKAETGTIEEHIKTLVGDADDVFKEAEKFRDQDASLIPLAEKNKEEITQLQEQFSAENSALNEIIYRTEPIVTADKNDVKKVSDNLQKEIDRLKEIKKIYGDALKGYGGKITAGAIKNFERIGETYEKLLISLKDSIAVSAAETVATALNTYEKTIAKFKSLIPNFHTKIREFYLNLNEVRLKISRIVTTEKEEEKEKISEVQALEQFKTAFQKAHGFAKQLNEFEDLTDANNINFGALCKNADDACNILQQKTALAFEKFERLSKPSKSQIGMKNLLNTFSSQLIQIRKILGEIIDNPDLTKRKTLFDEFTSKHLQSFFDLEQALEKLETDLEKEIAEEEKRQREEYEASMPLEH